MTTMALSAALRSACGRPMGVSARVLWTRGSPDGCRTLCVLVGTSRCGRSVDSRVFSDRTAACLQVTSRLGRAAAGHAGWQRFFTTDSDGKKGKREEDERAAAVLKRKLARDVETARNLALHQVVNVPNVITFARILSTPYLAYLIVQGDHKSAIGLLTVAGLSDWLDGYIARTYKQESIVGSLLDPFADKVLVGTLSLSMLWTGLLPWPLVTLIFGRDLMLVAGTFYYRLKTKDEHSGFFDTSDGGAFEVKPTLLSKANTALQLSTFGFALTNAAWQFPGDHALTLLFGVVGTTTFLSGAEYFWAYANKTGAFRPLRNAVERTKRNAVERTKRTLRK